VWKYWPDEEGAVTCLCIAFHSHLPPWKYWPDEEGAVTEVFKGSSNEYPIVEIIY